MISSYYRGLQKPRCMILRTVNFDNTSILHCTPIYFYHYLYSYYRYVRSIDLVDGVPSFRRSVLFSLPGFWEYYYFMF